MRCTFLSDLCDGCTSRYGIEKKKEETNECERVEEVEETLCPACLGTLQKKRRRFNASFESFIDDDNGNVDVFSFFGRFCCEVDQNGRRAVEAGDGEVVAVEVAMPATVAFRHAVARELASRLMPSKEEEEEEEGEERDEEIECKGRQRPQNAG